MSKKFRVEGSLRSVCIGNFSCIAMPSAYKIPVELPHQTVISCTANGRLFRLEGGGVGRPYDGKLGSVLKSTTGPLHITIHLLDIVAVFGYPRYSNYHEDTKDLFKISDGYEYERNIKYENGGHMKTLHKITPAPFRSLVWRLPGPGMQRGSPRTGIHRTFITCWPWKD